MRFTIKNDTLEDIIIPYSDSENETFSPDEEISFRDIISVKTQRGAAELVSSVLTGGLVVYRDGVELNESEGHIIVNSAIDYVANDNITIRDEDLKSDIDQNVTLNKYLILLFVDSEVKHKKVRSINYKTELSDGSSLHPVHNVGTDGLIKDTTYYADYVDGNNLGTEVLKVVEEYITDVAEPIPAARTVVSRSKKWDYKKTDGTYDTLKTKGKTYDTFPKQNKEGKKRRENTMTQTQIALVYGILFTGQAADQEGAQDLITALFEDYASAFITYEKSGKGTIYDDLLNDSSHSWLGATVPDIAQTQATIPECIGKDLRTISIDKLKGVL